MFGFAESGERVELTFNQQSGETHPSGEDHYFGNLGLASGGAGSWRVESTEPFPFLTGDRSTVSGSVTMEDLDGGTAEVEFAVTC